MPIGTEIWGAQGEITGAGTLPIPYPAGITAGMALLALWSVQTNTVNNPSGWNLLAEEDASNASPSVAATVKAATGSESGNLNITLGAAGHGIMVALPGASIVPTDSDSFPRGAASLTFPIPALDLLGGEFCVVAAAQNSSTGSFTGVPSGFTEIVDDASNPKWVVAYRANMPAGSTGTLTLTSSTSVRGGSIAVALPPAPSAFAGWGMPI